ncbi:MAG: hypothetical protein WCG75_12520, partial [Armatimonadota bacterium]
VMKIETNYPIDGKVSITFSGKSTQKKLAIRIPDWSDEINIDFPNSTEGAEYENGFMVFSHSWSRGTNLKLDIEMTAKLIQSHRLVLDNAGRIAVSYGPSIYCAENLKLESAPQLCVIDLGEEVRPIQKTAPDGSVLLQASVLRDKPSHTEALYEDFADADTVASTVSLIPYRLWNGKGKSYMQVWLRHN